MSDVVIELSQQAQTLTRPDRALLAALLLDSIHRVSNTGARAAWDVEIQRRIDERARGVAKLIPAEEVFAQVRRAIQ